MEGQILTKIRELLEGFQVRPEKVTPDARFDLLGLDSLDLVELAVKIEDAYEIDIEEADLEDVKTVGDAVRVVTGKLGART